MGLLGDPFVHQCWGRDVLSKNGLPQTDRGFGLIKPSGNDEIVGFIQDDKIVVKRPDSPTQLYHYELEPLSKADLLDGAEENATMSKKLSAFVQRATQSLLDNTTGAGQ
jgi:hypothetical protein